MLTLSLGSILEEAGSRAHITEAGSARWGIPRDRARGGFRQLAVDIRR